MSCARVSEIGAYVLGALDPAERSALERHLEQCAQCRAEVADLAGLPGLLGRLSLDEVTQLPAPSQLMLPRLLSEAAARNRRNRLRYKASAAAAAVVLLAAGAGVGIATRDSGHAARTFTASQGPVRATVALTDTAAGTGIRLDLSGVAAHESCRLIAIDRGGISIDAGSWYASYAGHAGVTETAAVRRADLVALRVQTLAGTPLVTVPLD